MSYLKNEEGSSEEGQEKKHKKEVIKEPVYNEEKVAYSKKELEEIINKSLENKLKEITSKYNVTKEDSNDTSKILRQLANIMKGDTSDNKAIDIIDFDPDDILKEPEIFYAVGTYLAVGGDSRNGINIKTPYNEFIIFGGNNGDVHRYKKGTGKNAIEGAICSAKIYRKKEVKFLKESSFYGTKIFQNLDEASNVDVLHAEYMTRISAELSALSVDKLINRARIEGLTITSDLNSLKQRLIQVIAERNLVNDKRKTAANVNLVGEYHDPIAAAKLV